MALFGKRSRLVLVAAGALLVLAGCKTTSYAGSGRSADYYQILVSSSIDDEDWQAGVEAIRNAPDKVDDDFHDWLEDNAERFPPIYLYAMADRFYDVDKERSVKWYFAARVRHAYDLMRCKDDRAMERLDVFEDRFRKTVFRFIRKDPKDAFDAAEKGLDWEYEADLHETSPASECRFGLALSKRSSFRKARYLDKDEDDEDLVSSRRAGKRLISRARRMVRREVEDIEDRAGGRKHRKSKRHSRKRGKRKILWSDDVDKDDWYTDDDDDDHDHDHGHAWNNRKWHGHDHHDYDDDHDHDHGHGHAVRAAWRDRPWRLPTPYYDSRPSYHEYNTYYVMYPDRYSVSYPSTRYQVRQRYRDGWQPVNF